MATVEQEAHDVATFLAWAADPKMEERKRTGFNVMVFLFVSRLAALLLLSARLVRTALNREPTSQLKRCTLVFRCRISDS